MGRWKPSEETSHRSGGKEDKEGTRVERQARWELFIMMFSPINLGVVNIYF